MLHQAGLTHASRLSTALLFVCFVVQRYDSYFVVIGLDGSGTGSGRCRDIKGPISR